MKNNIKLISLVVCLAAIILSCCSCGKCKDGEHKFKATTIKDATCTDEGIVIYKCEKCGYEEEDTTSAKGHNYVQQSTTVTCTKDGKNTYKCSRCGDIKEEDVKATGHNWIEATCQEPKHCSVCGVTEGGKGKHNFSDGKACSSCGKAVIISMPSFPKKVSELQYNNQPETTVEITDISYKVDSYDDGDNFVEFTISGKKIYDVEGNGISRETSFGYKVLDQNGIVKYSGNFNTTADTVGESFSCSLPYVGMVLNYIPSGEYRLEIQNSR